MANLMERASHPVVRVGGNTQETATLVHTSLPNGTMITKNTQDVSNPTLTPPLLYTSDVFYTMSNISHLVGVQWYLGIPLNDTSNLRLGIAEVGQAVLGSNILGFQVGNEPDLYVAHNHRPQGYTPQSYYDEFGQVATALSQDPNYTPPGKLNLIAPNLQGTWTPEMVWNTGFLTTYGSNMSAIAVEHYPTNNCFAQFGVGAPVDPQTAFAQFLTHQSGIDIVQPYLNTAGLAQIHNLPFVMFETNTASCGGLPGISDSFGAALWGADYSLQMAYSNFSGALMHVGGQGVYYNPFTPPPTNQSKTHGWTVGPIYYSNLIVAETFGKSGTAQIFDLQANGGNQFTPAYAIYDGGVPTKVALFNYVTDPSGASTYTATISTGGPAPSSVQVKYLSAPSVAEKLNMTWAGQTFSGPFSSDGRPRGDMVIQTVPCDQTAKTCAVTVPAPGFALVFLQNDAYGGPNSGSQTLTFSTSTLKTSTHAATVSIDPSVLATSNGHSGSNFVNFGSTSKPKRSSSIARSLVPSIVVLFSLVLGTFLVRRAVIR